MKNFSTTLLIKIIFSLQKFQNQGKKTGPEKQPGGNKTKKNESSKSRRGNHHVDEDSGGKILHESMLLKIQTGGHFENETVVTTSQGLKILALEKKIKLQELEIMNMKRSHQQNLSDI